MNPQPPDRRNVTNTPRTSNVDHAIELNSITKTFGGVRALDELDLVVPTGAVYGFLGPNGAGKSTAMRLLLGLIRSDSGTARLLGGDPWADAAELHRRIAYVPGDVTLWPGLTGGEVIDTLGRLRGGLDPTARAAMIERFQLDPTKRSRTYSKGNRQKVALVAAFAAEADLYLLDEPTSGLDPLMEAVFQDCVTEANQRGATVLLSSHILAEVEALCDRIGIISDGRMVQTGTLEELRHMTRTTVSATVSTPPDLSGLNGIHMPELHGDRITFSVESDQLGAALATLQAAGVRSLSANPPTLEELFLTHYDTAAAR